MIGAGLSGLVCAHRLVARGLEVTVFEKSRGVGGRMATRRTPEGLRFDHGAQYFTVRDASFERQVELWIADHVVAPWEGRICSLIRGQVQLKENNTPRFVGVPGMNSICKHLARDLKIEFRTEVTAPQWKNNTWNVSTAEGRRLGSFDCVISSAPAPQSAQLLASAPALQRLANGVKMQACWAGMLSFDQPLGLPLHGAFVQDSPLSWISRNDSKPDRDDDEESWVLHASPEWSEACIEDDAETALEKLKEAFWEATRISPRATRYAAGHRWRYALPPQPLESRCLFDAQRRIGACGDWCSGPRVEGAYLSGMAMADHVLDCLDDPTAPREQK